MREKIYTVYSYNRNHKDCYIELYKKIIVFGSSEVEILKLPAGTFEKLYIPTDAHYMNQTIRIRTSHVRVHSTQ